MLTIYQVGGINDPGISDIDLLVVFDDDTSCFFNPLNSLSKADRYFFTHSIFGISWSHFRAAQSYTFYSYKLLSGCDLPLAKEPIPSMDSEAVLKRQIALEFLITSYIKFAIELSYRCVNVRSLLLTVKALQYDLEFLSITSGKLFELIQSVVKWRRLWFSQRIENEKLKSWIWCFHNELKSFLNSHLKQTPLFLPADANLTFSKNTSLRDHPEVAYERKGQIAHYLGGHKRN